MFLSTVFAAALATSTAVTDTAIGDMSGRYHAEGTNLDGSPYRGDVEITQMSKDTCSIAWVTGGTSAMGICMRDHNAFSATYKMSNGPVGLVIYKIEDNGRLDGVWTVAGRDGTGTEILTPLK